MFRTTTPTASDTGLYHVPPRNWELAIYTLNIALIAGVGASLFFGNEEKAIVAPLSQYESQYIYFRYAVLVVSAALSVGQVKALWSVLVGLWPISLACLLTASSAFWSIDSRATLVNSGQLTLMVLFAIGVVTRFELACISRPFRMIGWATVVANIVLLIMQPQFAYNQDNYADTFRGLFIHKNTLGQFGMCAIIVISPSFFRIRTLAQTLSDLMLITLLLAMIVVSQSVSSIVISFCAISYVLFLWVITKTALPYFLNLLCVCATFAILILALAIWQDSILGMINRDATLTGRTALWEATWKAIQERPLLGFGYGAFWQSEQGAQARFGDAWIPIQAHNGYLQSLLDCGPILLILVLIHILMLLRHALLHSLYRVSPGGVFISVCSLTLPLYNMVEAVFIQVNSMPTLLLAAALSLSLRTTAVSTSGHATSLQSRPLVTEKAGQSLAVQSQFKRHI